MAAEDAAARQARRERAQQLRDQINTAYATGPDPEEQELVDAMWELQREVVLADDEDDLALLAALRAYQGCRLRADTDNVW